MKMNDHYGTWVWTQDCHCFSVYKSARIARALYVLWGLVWFDVAVAQTQIRGDREQHGQHLSHHLIAVADHVDRS